MKKLLPIIVVLFFLAACGQTENDTNGSASDTEETIETIKVDLQTPKQLEVDKKTTLKAVVSQGEEKVDDADEVEFEIWVETGKENSEMLTAEHVGDGAYAVEKAFAEEGVYYVQSHVTAREMHTMPKAKVIVGNPEESASVASAQHEQTKGGKHHESSVTMKLNHPDVVEAGKNTLLTVQLSKDDTPLEGVNATLEILKHGKDEPQWINLDEKSAGKYEKPVTLPDAGKYSVTIHVKKDDLHEHKEVTIEAQ